MFQFRIFTRITKMAKKSDLGEIEFNLMKKQMNQILVGQTNIYIFGIIGNWYHSKIEEIGVNSLLIFRIVELFKFCIFNTHLSDFVCVVAFSLYWHVSACRP